MTRASNPNGPLRGLADIGRILASHLASRPELSAILLIVVVVAIVVVSTARGSSVTALVLGFLVVATMGLFAVFMLSKSSTPPAQLTFETVNKQSAHAESEKVLAALENPKYDWRTPQGIARETDLPLGTVREILKDLSDLIFTAQDTNQKPVFTTRRKYIANQHIFDQTLTILSNRLN